MDDGNGGIDTIEVTITVTDVNEKPAFDETSPITRSVAENTAANQPIGQPVSATDPDNGDTLSYSLDSASAASFDIDSSTGQLKTKVALDYDTKVSYTVTVSVRDGKDDSGSADTATDATISVTITVTNENEPPVITGPSRKNYQENGTDKVATYTATDPEDSPQPHLVPVGRRRGSLLDYWRSTRVHAVTRLRNEG